MKKKILLLILMLFMPLVVSAVSVTTEWTNDVLISPSPFAEKPGSSFVAGDNVKSDKIVDGILFAAGSNVTVSGTNEYGLYAGNNITVNSTVLKDLFAAGNVISFNKDVNIGRDAYIAGNKIDVSGTINGNLKIYGRSIDLSDTHITGELYIGCESVTIGDNVVVDGKIKYNDDAIVSGSFDSNAVIEKYKTASNENTVNGALKAVSEEKVATAVIAIASIMIVALVLNALFPKINKSLDKKITVKKTFANMGIGFAILILLPIAAVIAMITGVGLGIGALALAIYVIALCLSLLPVMVIIGENLLTSVFKLKSNQYLSIMTGVIVVKLVSYIPVFGGIIYFLLMLVGLGYIKELMFPKKVNK